MRQPDELRGLDEKGGERVEFPLSGGVASAERQVLLARRARNRFLFKVVGRRACDFVEFDEKESEEFERPAAVRLRPEKVQQVTVDPPRREIARAADRAIPICAGEEVAVASTKAYNCQLIVLYLMGLEFARAGGTCSAETEEIAAAFDDLPRAVGEVLSEREKIREIAYALSRSKAFFFLGKREDLPAAREGALKLKEISYVHAEGYHAAELKHGPISLLDERHPVLALANDIPGRDKILGNIQECRARRAPVVAVATVGDREVENLTDDVIFIPHCSRFIAPLPTTVALQLFAYYIAVERGCEIDQPRNLAKSVTVE